MMAIALLSSLFPQRARPVEEVDLLRQIRIYDAAFEGIMNNIERHGETIKDGCVALASEVENGFRTVARHLQGRKTDLETHEAWRVLEFASRGLRAMKDTGLYLRANEPHYFMVRQSERRCQGVQGEILDKLAPSFTKIPRESFLQEMRIRHIDHALYTPLKEKVEVQALLQQATTSHDHRL